MEFPSIREKILKHEEEATRPQMVTRCGHACDLTILMLINHFSKTFQIPKHGGFYLGFLTSSQVTED
jgi:hypothetical protein